MGEIWPGDRGRRPRSLREREREREREAPAGSAAEGRVGGVSGMGFLHKEEGIFSRYFSSALRPASSPKLEKPPERNFKIASKCYTSCIFPHTQFSPPELCTKISHFLALLRKCSSQATTGSRTHDLALTERALCQLRYGGQVSRQLNSPRKTTLQNHRCRHILESRGSACAYRL